MAKTQILVACQVQGCAEEVSYHLEQVRWYKDKPVCEQCYEMYFCADTDQLANVEPDWDELPEISLEDLVA